MAYHLKFALFHLLSLLAILGFVVGGPWLWSGFFVAFAVVIPGDLLCGEDLSVPKQPRTGLLNLQLYLALPLLLCLVFPLMWMASSGDPLGFGAALGSLTGYDMFTARAATTGLHYLGGFFSANLFIAIIGTLVAHELVHRTWNPSEVFLGRVLLAFSFDSAFSIEHVYGHHEYIGSKRDPATAPRGRNVYQHIFLSTWQGNVSAWRLEHQRLGRKQLATWSYHNRVIRGWLMSLLVLALIWFVFGWQACAYFVLCGLGAKSLLEVINFIEHYGLIRVASQACKPHHSWNSNRVISSWSLFNLTRHSDHHEHGEKPYWALRSYPDAPMMISGYLATLAVTFIPPLWNHLMAPKLLDWDLNHATPEERVLAQKANRESGIAVFTGLNRKTEVTA